MKIQLLSKCFAILTWCKSTIKKAVYIPNGKVQEYHVFGNPDKLDFMSEDKSDIFGVVIKQGASRIKTLIIYEYKCSKYFFK